MFCADMERISHCAENEVRLLCLLKEIERERERVDSTLLALENWSRKQHQVHLTYRSFQIQPLLHQIVFP